LTTLVFSYSHADEDLRNELEIHLATLKRQGLIETWHDRRILAGQEFAGEINQSFKEADVILLLVSPNFIASEYCYNVELKQALQRHDRKEAVVIPVILRPCDWHDLPFGKLLAATVDGKPVVHFPTHDDGFLQVVQAIKKAIHALPKLTSTEPTQSISEESVETTAGHNNIERSSNLRIKRGFTDRDRDQARVQTFEYVAGYFENSLSELHQRNPGVEMEFRRVDANSFEAAIYVEGQRKSKCGIWISGNAISGGDIFYSHNGITRNSYNESMSMADDGYLLGFKPLGMTFQRNPRDALLNSEGVAEYFWEMFISPLQQ
jgi:hypothetical protein